MKDLFSKVHLPQGNKVFLTSLGCARNLVDSEVMVGILLRAGFETTLEVSEADFLIVNTCGFLASARDEALATFRELFKSKKESGKVIAAGCMVQSHSEVIKEHFPQMHYFLGSGDVEKILEAVCSSEKGSEVSSRQSYLQVGEVPRLLSTPRHYAYIKIAEGCKKRCSYCIIPVIKGALKSKSEAQVLSEFDALLKSGVKEIILIAQDLGDYGRDRDEKEALANLLEAMSQREGDFWIRLLYLYPDELTPRVVSAIKADTRICRYIDMPLQHIDDEVLKRMHRKSSSQEIEQTLANLRKELPSLTIRTSLMVGFPGETEEQFEKLVRFVKKAKIDHVGIFTYSREEKSYSHKLDGHLPEDVKKEREARLAKAQQKVVKNLLRPLVGQKIKVLIEGFHPESRELLVGRFEGQAPDVDGQVILNEGALSEGFGQFYLVEISDVFGYDLVGKIIKPLTVATETPKKESHHHALQLV